MYDININLPEYIKNDDHYQRILRFGPDIDFFLQFKNRLRTVNVQWTSIICLNVVISSEQVFKDSQDLEVNRFKWCMNSQML